MNDIHFEGSEEERMQVFDEDLDEGFNLGVDEGESRRENIDGADTNQQKNCMFTIEDLDR